MIVSLDEFDLVKLSLVGSNGCTDGDMINLFNLEVELLWFSIIYSLLPDFSIKYEAVRQSGGEMNRM